MATWQKEKRMRHLAIVTVDKALGGHDVQSRPLEIAGRQF